ncbi:hypothetical protein MKW98_029008 [Papaver atlanticum]|uniref:chitinase n=1 Tax=Papaver atlanticum TaxID=357466 RepID=A0AAD4TLH4_9MAGN|nr:hypothetical protein MKW98_029008 [Papaver atlanticum]
MVGFNFVNLIALIGIFLATLLQTIVGQNCGCAPDLCCSRSRMCGLGEEFCGLNCIEGPCYNVTPVSDTVTFEFFNGIKNGAEGNTCPGMNFYWRGSFLDALKSYPLFGQEGSADDSKREIAAFFAHVTYETGNFCKIEEIDGQSKDYCIEESEKYPCTPGKQYYGRGPFQLSWNFNYGAAGKSIGFDGLNAPETVAKDPIISFKTALWFWMQNAHPLINSDQGFGGTTRAIALECNGEEARINYYKSYCDQFGVSPGDNLTC